MVPEEVTMQPEEEEALLLTSNAEPRRWGRGFAGLALLATLGAATLAFSGKRTPVALSSHAFVEEVAMLSPDTCPNNFLGARPFDHTKEKCCRSFESGAVCPLGSTCCCHAAFEEEGRDCLGGIRCCTTEQCAQAPGQCLQHLNDSRPHMQLCGHSEHHCDNTHPRTPSFFVPECYKGGLGCNAHGKRCCRFCGFGHFSDVPCPSSGGFSGSSHGIATTQPAATAPPPATTWPPATAQPPSTSGVGGLLLPVSTEKPDKQLFERHVNHRLPHVCTEVADVKATNKFWTNWVVQSGLHLPVFPMPYALKWGHHPGGPPKLLVSNGKPHVHHEGGRVKYYFTPFITELALGAGEASSHGQCPHTVVQEGLFGIRVEVRGSGGKRMTFPIFSGAAYISALYTGGFTPQLSSEASVTHVGKVRDGVFGVRNGRGTEFRVYVLDRHGNFASGSWAGSAQTGWLLDRPLEGWVRLARVVQPSDAELLDAHAQAVVTGMELQVPAAGKVLYRFEKTGQPAVLHWAYAHHLKLLHGAQVKQAHIQAPTKGHMRAVVGDTWALRVDLTGAADLDFLPEKEPAASRTKHLQDETAGTIHYFRSHWQAEMFKGTFYFSGKGFQKVGMLCLLAEKFFGRSDSRTQDCAAILEKGFRCLYDHSAAGDCPGAPPRMFYDEQWGGLVTSSGYSTDGCLGGADYGNACYNDHHYHYGYFVVSAAILTKLKPEYRRNAAFVGFVNMMVRDTTNPSEQDGDFPRFRAFDWFDLHSWSRGLPPATDGKDQESTSEELNLLWGLRLWGGQVGNHALEQLGTTMLALDALTIREFFLMESNNPHHAAGFANNHATGIFFQNKVDYATWFGPRQEYIHGIQMLPLSPALKLTRTKSFCRQEWDHIVSKLPLSPTDRWTSILLSGSLAFTQPSEAHHRLSAINPSHFDDGLTKAWALYWAATQ